MASGLIFGFGDFKTEILKLREAKLLTGSSDMHPEGKTSGCLKIPGRVLCSGI
jgi:hypothetical protein